MNKCQVFISILVYLVLDGGSSVETASFTGVITSTVDTCVDTHNDCAVYTYDKICIGNLISWSQTNCRKFCNFCSAKSSSVATTVATSHGTDTISSVETTTATSLTSEGLSVDTTTSTDVSSSVATTVSTNTSLSVEITSTSSLTSTAATCEDAESDCAAYGYDFICHDNMTAWSQIHCRKFCNICSDGSSSVGTSTSLLTKESSSVATTTAASLVTNGSSSVETLTSTGMVTSTTATCVDADSDCAAYGYEFICHGDFIPWSLIHCRSFCNLCSYVSSSVATTVSSNTSLNVEITTSTSSLTSTAATCEDADSDCAAYGYNFICHDNMTAWSQIHCRKFCNICSEESSSVATTTAASLVTNGSSSVETLTSTGMITSTTATCVDADSDCAAYGYEFICHGDFIPWSLIHCRRFCNLCSYVSSSVATTVSTNTSSSVEIANSTSSLTSTAATCEDVESDCAAYGYDFICHNDLIAWSQIHCRKFCNLCSDSSSSVEPSTTSPTKESSSVATTTAASQVTSTTATCIDADSDCAAYGYDFICHGDFIPWSLIHCRRFCNLCSYKSSSVATTVSTSMGTHTNSSVETTTTSSSLTSTEATCEDVESDCASYGYDFICHNDMTAWSQKHCRKFCNLCSDGSSSVVTSTTTPTSTGEPCVDADSDCAEYGADYICYGDFIPWSQIHCRKFCNLCSGSCYDKDSDCAEYGYDFICNGDLIPWSLIHCTRFCGLCDMITTPVTMTTTTAAIIVPTKPLTTTSTIPTTTTTAPTTTTPTTTTPTTTTPTTTTPTTTLIPEMACGNVETVEYCAEYHLDCSDPWMYEHCRGFCKLCLHDPLCTDDTSNCADFKDFICSDNSMKFECKKTCNVCT